MNPTNIASFIWSIAELLRGDYKQSDYGKVILPFSVLRRMDCVLEPTKAAVLAEFEAQQKTGLPPEQFLLDTAGLSFFNTSPMDMPKLLGDAANLKANLLSYIAGFSENVRDIFEKFEFDKQVEKLDAANLLFLVVQRFASVDLHPDVVPNAAMGHLFEELIRKFAELSNETAGEHFTPREVIRLMVNLLFIEDQAALGVEGAVRTLYDPTAGTGGMLSVGEEHLLTINPNARLAIHGQERNAESWAICKADMLVKGQDISNIVLGDTLSDDGHVEKKFDYMLSNPPFGGEWKKVESAVRKEHRDLGYGGRFGPGLPRIADGSLLFLLHLVSKMRDPALGGSRIGIVLNGSPLFIGGAGSGESEIRKYLIENDFVEAVIALPTEMFYNTGIATYVWLLSNKKPGARKGKIQLIDASAFKTKMRKSLGNKRVEISPADIDKITHVYAGFQDLIQAAIYDHDGAEVSRALQVSNAPLPVAPKGGRIEVAPVSKIFDNRVFGYTNITIERPLRLLFRADESSLSDLERRVIGSAKAPPRSDVLGARQILISLRDKGDIASREEAQAAIDRACSAFDVRLTVWMRKVIWSIIERRDPKGEIQYDSKGEPESDSDLRDSENVPLTESIEDYFSREVLPHAPDAWIDHAKSKIGYDIPFNKHFYVLKKSRSLEEIDAELKSVTDRILKMIAGLSA